MWLPHNLTYETHCYQATSDYLNQCWHSSISPYVITQWSIRGGKNSCHFADIFKYIFLNENYHIFSQISPRYVPKGPISYNSTLIWGNGLALKRQKAITWSNGDPIHWCIHMSTGHNVLTLNTLRPRQNGCHFADDIFKCIFLNENVWIPVKISLKFVPKGPINNIPALVQIMAWRRPGDKPLSEPITVVSLPTQICVTRPQWVNHNVWQLLVHVSFTISIHHRWKLLFGDLIV